MVNAKKPEVRKLLCTYTKAPPQPMGYVVSVPPPYSHSAARDAHLLLLDTASVQRENAARAL